MCDRETIKCFTLLSVGESGSYCKVNFNEMYQFEHLFADTPGVHELPKIRNDPGGGYSLYSDDRDGRRIFRGCDRRFQVVFFRGSSSEIC